MPNEYLNNKLLESFIIRFQKAKKDKAEYEKIFLKLKKSRNKRVKRISISGIITQEQYEIEFELCMKEYTETQEWLTGAFYTLAENISKYDASRYPKFNLIDPEDAIQEGVIVCFDKIDRFDPTKGHAFSYFTQIQINSNRQLYRSSKSYSEFKRKYQDVFIQNNPDDYVVKRSKERVLRIAAKNSHEQN